MLYSLREKCIVFRLFYIIILGLFVYIVFFCFISLGSYYEGNGLLLLFRYYFYMLKYFCYVLSNI